MKQTLLIALLGTTITLAVPTLSYADSAYKFQSKALERDHRYKHKHKHKHHHNKSQVKRDRRHNVKRHNHKFNNDYNKNNASFSISWNVGDSTISYGNDNFAYNNVYQNNHNYNKYRGKRIYKRLNHQRNRIQRGIQNGQLVKREVRKLRREQRYIRDTLSQYKRDGYLNRYERSKMNQLLDIASNNIHRKMNNRRTRYSQQQYNYGYAQY